MSKQSLAVNNSGALTDTSPAPGRWADLDGHVERSRGPLCGIAGFDEIVVGPGGSLVVERILVRERMKQLYS